MLGKLIDIVGQILLAIGLLSAGLFFYLLLNVLTAPNPHGTAIGAAIAGLIVVTFPSVLIGSVLIYSRRRRGK
jgi:hypothetical protein